MLALISATAGTLAVASAAWAAPGDLDQSFGTGGKVRTDFASANDEAYGVALQSDGKIVVVGVTGNDFAVARYLASGGLDPSFGTGGKVTTDFSGQDDKAWDVAVQADGKIIAIGVTDSCLDNSLCTNFALARYTATGALDSTFGTGGRVTTSFGGWTSDAHGLALQPDGKIVVAGTASGTGGWDFAVARYNTDGTLDTSFGTGGKVTTDIVGAPDLAYEVAVQPDGKIVLAGGADNGTFGLVRYNANGTLDTSFGTGGKVATDFSCNPLGCNWFTGDERAYDLVVHPDGKLTVVGGHDNLGAFALARYTAAGVLDTTFDGDGLVTTSIGGYSRGTSLALQPDGKLVAGGRASFSFGLARYETNGALDSTFGTAGKVVTDFAAGGYWETAWGLAIQPDGKIVAVGGSDGDFVLARYSVSPTDFYADPTVFTGAAGTLTTVNFDATPCGAPIAPPGGGMLAAGLYAQRGVTFSSGVIVDGGSFAASSPNIVSNTQLNTPTPALVDGTFTTPVSAVGITNVGAGAVLRVYDSAGNLIASLQTDTIAAASDFVGIVSTIPIKRFEFDFVSGIGFGGDDLRFTTIATPDCTPPSITVPAPITAGTDPGAATAVVTYAASATDAVDPSPSLFCSPASGSTFSLGATLVTCTATDASDNTASTTFTVTVVDDEPPQVTCPSGVTVDATSASGAPVTYSATASDNVGVVSTGFSPPSGSTFPIGASAVTFTASDGVGNAATCTFTVTVVDGAGQITDLETIVQSFNLQPQGIENSLLAKLDAALAALAGGNTATACQNLQSFINEVNAQRGKKLTTAQADQLIAEATQIRTVLGCP